MLEEEPGLRRADGMVVNGGTRHAGPRGSLDTAPWTWGIPEIWGSTDLDGHRCPLTRLLEFGVGDRRGAVVRENGGQGGNGSGGHALEAHVAHSSPP